MAFASGPTNPGPTTNLVEKTARNRGRCGRHIVCPRTLLSRADTGEVRQPHHVASQPFPNLFPRLRSVLLGVGGLDCIVEGSDPGEVRQTHHASSLNSFPGQIRERCGRHIMRPRSTPFRSRGWCDSHIMWLRTRPVPVFAPNRRRILCSFAEVNRAGICFSEWY